MKIFSILILLLLLLDNGTTVNIDKRLKGELVKKVNAAKTKGPKSVDDIVSPQVLIWDPLTQLPWFFQEGIKCPHCQEKLRASKYMVGQSKRRQPMLIHGKSSNILLVSRMLRCPHSHACISHSQYVLDMMPRVAVPFILSHKGGFERSLAYELYNMISTGMEISECVKLLTTSRNTYFNGLLEMLEHHPDKQQMLKSRVLNNIRKIMTPVPGRKMIRRCFECVFNEKRKFLEDSLKGTTTSNWISIDHTFKSVKHIKVNVHGRYLTQIRALCTITNDIGQVLAWQLCKSTTFNEIKPVLEKLRDRFAKQKVALKEIFLDQCCAWRNLIEDVFGTDITVKLDLFHATQRVTKFIPKFHPLSKHLFKDLGNVFRYAGDIGKKRQKETPPPDYIARKMKHFDKKWRQYRLKHKGKTVYPKAAQKEVQKLSKHIAKGCVSGIKPGRGTIRNEALHRRLNQRMNKNRISPTFAIALMFTIIHAINSQLARSYKRKLHLVDSVEEFGLPSQDDIRENDESETDDDTLGQETVDCKLGIWKLVKNSAVTMDANLACDHGIELLLHSFERKNDVNDESSLDKNLAAFGLLRVPSEADGSCLFMSVSMQLIQLLTDEDIGTKVFEHLSTLFPDLFCAGKPCNIDQETLAVRLRAAMVDQWLDNEEVYREFAPDVNFKTDARHYLRRDVFDGDLGDLMVLALSNVLNMAIILITPDQDIPLIPVFPSKVFDKRACMYLAFDKNNMHFDSTTRLSSTPEPDDAPPITPSPISSSCSCGVNDPTPSKRCSANVKNSYRSRCPCSKQQQPCGASCRCKGCTNSYGQRNHTTSQLQRATLRRAKRQRSKEWMDSKAVPSRDFMKGKGYNLKAFSKKDDIHLKQMNSPASSAYLKKKFSEEQIKRRQKILASREKYAKYAVKLNKKGPSKRPMGSESVKRKCGMNDKTWEAGLYSAEQVIDQRMENGSKKYLVKWSGSDICTWEPEKNIYDTRLIAGFKHSLAGVSGNNTSSDSRRRKKKTLE